MSKIIIGSARHDENGRYVGGKAGDQTGSEVSTQEYYLHKKGWFVYRCVSEVMRQKLAEAMIRACLNNNIGYAQDTRYTLEQYGTGSKYPCNTDCSELIRVCVKEACGVDLGAATTTENIGDRLVKTKLFVKMGKVGVQINANDLFAGDILCTCTKGHVVAVVEGKKDGKEKVDGTDLPASKPNLRFGSRGTEVKKLQTLLNNCNNAGLVVDGIFGKNTRAALVAFQKNHDLVPDGVYGGATAGRFREILNV